MPKAIPSAHILQSMQAQSIEWWKRIAELIDNALDANATIIGVSFRDRKLTVTDNGHGIADPQDLVTLGSHKKQSAKCLGRYGIGAKDAWLVTGPVIEIDSVRRGVRRTLTADVRHMEQNEWDIPETIVSQTTDKPGTTIRITLKNKTAPPLWKDISERLGWVFAPAINSGRQIINLDSNTPLMATRLPPLRNTVVDTFEVEGREVSLQIGLLPISDKVKFGPFWIQHGHRTVLGTGIGTGGRGVGRIAGVITLGEGWMLSKNKDDVCDVLDPLADAIQMRIEHLLLECESTAMQVQTDAIKAELDQRLKAVAPVTLREKRDKTGTSKGTVTPKGTGRKRVNATKTTDQPGSVIATEQQSFDSRQIRPRGFSVQFTEESNNTFGRFDAPDKCVHLNQCHPSIAYLKKTENRDALLMAAEIIIADHDAKTEDGGQRVMGFAIGDCFSPFVKLVTSTIGIQEVENGSGK